MAGVVGLRELKDAFRSLGEETKVRTVTGVALAGQKYSNDVKEGAPYKTGTLRRSVHVEMQMVDDQPVALVGTDVVYARRQEYGFIGADSLGRIYHQIAHPYFRPPLDRNWREYQQIIREAIFR
jgi:hypothetical protein